MFDHVAGHKKQIEFLNKSFDMGKIAHAYIFSGPAFVGKRLVARNFANQLLGSEKEFNPDFQEICGDEAIKIEQVRELIYKLSLQPYQAKYKIALIDNAENMTVEAQNALLKLLEEPKSYTVIILVTANAGKLLRTISSRAQKINFGPVQESDYGNLLPATLPPEAKNLVLNFAAGRPGLALAISSDEDLVSKLAKVNQNFAIAAGADLAEKLKLAYDLAELETADLKQALDFWLIKFQQKLSQQPDIRNARNTVQVNLARRLLDQNVNSKLLLTNLMLNLV